MIQIKCKEDCVGCGACHDICPKSAISFVTDEEGFWYPIVDADKCVDCGLCDKVCPIINSEELNKTNIDQPIVFSAYNSNPEVRFLSTTGGIYSALAEKMFEQGGYIGGAVWTENLQVKHIVSNKPEDLLRLRGSKYLQSDSTGLFKEIKGLLIKGEKVLVCGCPCQMAALRAFLQKEYENLIVVDFICCSINSPKVFKEYIKSMETEYGSKVINYHPKNKEYGGWHNFAFKATFADGQIYVKRRTEDDFTHCFIGSHVAARPSCFECHYKSVPRVADITIADFWGIEKVNPEMDSPHGTSVVLLNNEKGRLFFNLLGNKVITNNQTLEEAKAGNANLYKSIQELNLERDKFYYILNTNGFKAAMKYSRSFDSKPSTLKKIKCLIKKVLQK
jgi:coenzyme F420-reducing hydrogenase beta subunit